MLRFAKVIASTALGLTISFSLFTPGVFAQSINQSSANHPIVAQATNVSENAELGVTNSYNYPTRYTNGQDQYRGHYVRCVRVSRWVRVRHGFRRVWYRVCHRY